MHRLDIVRVLEEIAILLELKGENPFKVRAYQSGARALETMEADLGERIEAGELAQVSGIGEALASKIEVLYREGALPLHEELKAAVPAGLLDMVAVPGLGGKKVKKLHEALGIDTLEALETACREGRVAAIAGFGAKSESKILSGIENLNRYAARHLWWDAASIAEPILDALRGLKVVEQAAIAGSLRRLKETVGDLDFIVAAADPAPVMELFTGLDAVAEVTAKGATKSSVRFDSGLQADLRVVPPAQYPFALHHFTGSKEHNVAMRQCALARGYSLSEWGLTERSREDAEPALMGVRSEDDLFAFLGLAPIPPELREGLGELDAAASGDLPRLVELGDLRGVFHNHTTASDGRNTIAEMAAAAGELGWEYIGLADHSKASFQANGLDEERVAVYMEAVASFNASGTSAVHVFAGIECDILKDGSMDLDDATLDRLDYVVASVHSSFSMGEDEMTRRMIRAIEHPATTMLGHPSGRLLLKREPYRVDLQRVIDAAIANGVVIEINANPRRLDMDWRLWRRAAERGLRCAINPDAHDTTHLAFVQAGVNAARKGWLGPENVLNTQSLEAVKGALRRGKG